MSDSDTIAVRVGNTRITVPVYRTPGETEALAAELTEALRDIEAASDRINTQAFALQLAFACAVRAAEAERSAEADTREVARALDQLLKRLRALVATTDTDGEEEPPPEGPAPNVTRFRA